MASKRTTDSRLPPFGLPAELVADVRLVASGVDVTLRGDIDVHTAPLLRDRLGEVVRQGEERVVVHLDEVTFLDSTGLGVLIGAHKAQRRSGAFELVCEEPRILRILTLTGLDRVFTINGRTP
jgi:anti-sigma B factor antagonist